MSACITICDAVHNASEWLNYWQTLISGLLALGAAIWAGSLLRGQIGQAEEFRRDEISRKHRAARIALPLTLSAVSELTQATSDVLAEEYERYGPDGAETLESILAEGNDKRFSPIALSEEAIGSFERFVESLNNQPDVRHVAELMGSIQLLISRFNGFDRNGAGAKVRLPSLILDAAKVKLLNDRIFNYARFVDDQPFGIVGISSNADGWDGIHKCAKSLVFFRDRPNVFYSEFQKAIQSYKDQDETPWLEKFEE